MIDTIYTGGQTGADQGGLKAAKACGYQTGGWAPDGWLTDTGAAPWLASYGLKELKGFKGYRPRTLRNVYEAEALIWVGNPFSPGGVLTLGENARRGHPLLLLPYPDTVYTDTVEAIRTFVFQTCKALKVLMIAGNRERTNPGIEAYTIRVLGEGLIPF